MYRFIALAFVFAAVACGGGGASSDDDTPTNTPASPTASTQIAGANTQTGTPAVNASAPGTYEVAEGDTLSDIAARFDTTVEVLVEANQLASADELTIGQVLKIATPAATATPAPPGTATPAR